MTQSKMANRSRTTRGSRGSSRLSSKAGSSVVPLAPVKGLEPRVRRGWVIWTKEEMARIKDIKIRDAFYEASRAGSLAEFVQEHFPGRSIKSVYNKIARIEQGKDKRALK